MLKSCMITVVLLAIAAPAMANTKRQQSCAITASIVSQAVAARIAGRTSAQTKAALRAEDSGITGIYKATIPALVDMVYGFEESTLGDGVVDQYETQCLNF